MSRRTMAAALRTPRSYCPTTFSPQAKVFIIASSACQCCLRLPPQRLVTRFWVSIQNRLLAHICRALMDSTGGGSNPTAGPESPDVPSTSTNRMGPSVIRRPGLRVEPARRAVAPAPRFDRTHRIHAAGRGHVDCCVWQACPVVRCSQSLWS